MARAKRARKAETPKQPSPSLWLRTPYFYPTPSMCANVTRGAQMAASRVMGIGTPQGLAMTWM
jgi:hypothetical protein